MDIQNYLKNCQGRVNKALAKRLPSAKKSPQQLHQAMRYSLEGGKRIRAAFVYASGEAARASLSLLDDISSAIEMIHAYSLIHDDLPALDNDDLRRGKPTCHKVFGVATAILAGDALQTLAFEILSKPEPKNISASKKLEIIHSLAQASGSMGMIGGEELDIKMTNQTVTVQQIKQMYSLKTGCLLSASILLGAQAGNFSKKDLQQLAKFGEYLGIAFQIHDDIIGIESDTKTLGKKQAADLAMNKPVYPVIVGMTQAKKDEKIIYDKALFHLDKINKDTKALKALAAFVIERNY